MNQPTENAQEAPAENPETEVETNAPEAEATAEGGDENASENPETSTEEQAPETETPSEEETEAPAEEPASEPETEDEPEEDTGEEPEALLVVDSSVNEENPIRVHDIIIDGEIVEITFKLGEPTVLPFKQGVKFMKDGFVVSAASGDDLNLPAVPTDNVAAQLAADETVAKYGELTFTALKLRASQKKDGEIYLDADETDRSDIINFLIGNAPQEEESPVEDDGDEVETIDGSEEKIIPDADVLAKKLDDIVRHFSDGLENVTSREIGEENGAKVYAVVHVDLDAGEKVLVQGTLVDLHQATIEGVSSGRFNSDQDAKAPVEKGQEEADFEGTFTLEQIEGATDEALRLAVEHGVDIDDVEGTGEDGNILVGDVEAYIEASKPEAPAE